MLIYALLFLLIYAAITYRSNKWGIFLILGLLPTYLIRFKIGPIPFTLLEAMVLTLFSTWLIKQLKNKQPLIKSSRLIGPAIFLLIAATLSALISPNIISALGIWKAYFIEPVLFWLVFISIIKTKKDWQQLIASLVVSVIGISIIAFFQKLNPAGINLFGHQLWAIPNEFWSAQETRRVTSFYGFPNAIGLFFAPLTVMFIGALTWTKNNLYKLFLILTAALTFLIIVWAVSEGAVVAIAAGLLFLGIAFKKSRLPTIIAAILLIAISLTWSPISTKVIPEITFQNPSGQVRLMMWRETASLINTQPLTGAGLAGYQTAVAPFHKADHIEIYLYPHNIILNLWSELGLLGLIAFVWLLIIFFKLIYQNRKKSQALVLAAVMITILIHGLVDAPYFKNDLAVFFWMLLGLSHSLDKI